MALSNNALCTVEELKDYLATYPEGNSMFEIYIDSASGIIREFLGYDPIQTTYAEETYIGFGMDSLDLSVRNVTSVAAIVMAGDTQDVSNITLHDWYITSPDYDFTEDAIILATFVAGWPFQTLPDVIKLTCLRIAGILASEGENNVGVTSKFFEDGSRTFITRRFDIYLELLKHYQRFI